MIGSLRAYSPALLFTLLVAAVVLGIHIRDAARADYCNRHLNHYQACLRYEPID